MYQDNLSVEVVILEDTDRSHQNSNNDCSRNGNDDPPGEDEAPPGEDEAPPGEDEAPLPNCQTAESEKDSSDTEFSSNTRRWMYKNAIGLSVATTVVFSAFQGLQNLQSSLYPEGGLGVTSLAILYTVLTLSCFITPGLIKLLSTKYALLGGFFSHLIYTVANYYPSWYTLVPASLINGLGTAPLWAAANAHLVQVAVISAPKLGLDQNILISNLVGMFFFFFFMSQFPGNLASSLIFYPYSGRNDTTDRTNSSTFNRDFCGVHDNLVLDKLYLYILVSVYFIVISIGIIIHCTFVSKLPVKHEKYLSRKKWLRIYIWNPIIDTLSIMKEYKMVLALPLPVATGLEQSFAYGTFTQIVVAECFGTYLVGFTIMVLGAFDSLASLLSGKLVKWVPHYILFLIGGVINIGLLIFLVLWRLSPSYVVVFLFVSLWGVADAIWNTMTASLFGILYPNKSELAYSVHRIGKSVGSVIGFGTAQFLSLRGRCFMVLAVIVVALISDLVLEFKTLQKRETLLPWFLRSLKSKMEVKEESNVNLISLHDQ